MGKRMRTGRILQNNNNNKNLRGMEREQPQCVNSVDGGEN